MAPAARRRTAKQRGPLKRWFRKETGSEAPDLVAERPNGDVEELLLLAPRVEPRKRKQAKPLAVASPVVADPFGHVERSTTPSRRVAQKLEPESKPHVVAKKAPVPKPVVAPNRIYPRKYSQPLQDDEKDSLLEPSLLDPFSGLPSDDSPAPTPTPDKQIQSSSSSGDEMTQDELDRVMQQAMEEDQNEVAVIKKPMKSAIPDQDGEDVHPVQISFASQSKAPASVTLSETVTQTQSSHTGTTTREGWEEIDSNFQDIKSRMLDSANIAAKQKAVKVEKKKHVHGFHSMEAVEASFYQTVEESFSTSKACDALSSMYNSTAGWFCGPSTVADPEDKIEDFEELANGANEVAWIKNDGDSLVAASVGSKDDNNMSRRPDSESNKHTQRGDASRRSRKSKTSAKPKPPVVPQPVEEEDEGPPPPVQTVGGKSESFDERSDITDSVATSHKSSAKSVVSKKSVARSMVSKAATVEEILEEMASQEKERFDPTATDDASKVSAADSVSSSKSKESRCSKGASARAETTVSDRECSPGHVSSLAIVTPEKEEGAIRAQETMSLESTPHEAEGTKSTISDPLLSRPPRTPSVQSSKKTTSPSRHKTKTGADDGSIHSSTPKLSLFKSGSFKASKKSDSSVSSEPRVVSPIDAASQRINSVATSSTFESNDVTAVDGSSVWSGKSSKKSASSSVTPYKIVKSAACVSPEALFNLNCKARNSPSVSSSRSASGMKKKSSVTSDEEDVGVIDGASRKSFSKSVASKSSCGKSMRLLVIDDVEAVDTAADLSRKSSGSGSKNSYSLKTATTNKTDDIDLNTISFTAADEVKTFDSKSVKSAGSGSKYSRSLKSNATDVDLNTISPTLMAGFSRNEDTQSQRSAPSSHNLENVVTPLRSNATANEVTRTEAEAIAEELSAVSRRSAASRSTVASGSARQSLAGDERSTHSKRNQGSSLSVSSKKSMKSMKSSRDELLAISECQQMSEQQLGAASVSTKHSRHSSDSKSRASSKNSRTSVKSAVSIQTVSDANSEGVEASLMDMGDVEERVTAHVNVEEQDVQESWLGGAEEASAKSGTSKRSTKSDVGSQRKLPSTSTGESVVLLMVDDGSKKSSKTKETKATEITMDTAEESKATATTGVSKFSCWIDETKSVSTANSSKAMSYVDGLAPATTADEDDVYSRTTEAMAELKATMRRTPGASASVNSKSQTSVSGKHSQSLKSKPDCISEKLSQKFDEEDDQPELETSSQSSASRHSSQNGERDDVSSGPTFSPTVDASQEPETIFFDSPENKLSGWLKDSNGEEEDTVAELPRVAPRKKVGFFKRLFQRKGKKPAARVLQIDESSIADDATITSTQLDDRIVVPPSVSS